MKRTKLLLIALLVLALSLLLSACLSGSDAPVVPAGATPSDDDVNAVAGNMFCPVCENTPLDVCPTAACAQWRDEIRSMLADGASAQDVYDYFQLKYGDRVLSAPPAEGFNWGLYVIPPLLILLAIYVLMRVVLANKRPQAQPVETASEVDQETMSRLEAELKERDN